MASILNEEEVLCSINSYRNIKIATKMGNILTNVITGGIAGGVVNDFKLSLTPDNLYIQAIEYAAWGGLPEVLYTNKIPREDIKNFKVKNEENKEFITIIIVNDEELNFIRDNEQKNDLASIMAAIISNSKNVV
ncbi:hypothetical protein D2A34_11610 [Clostridium chromiireducens]|uniref:Uncharacterized protein n=1 Tax=Clostridium chromiireducens TaxID=225345 RepID=A0A399IQQ1_9CLOT|nr:hypothetical protein [Clostridium chromiireducens]MVX63272.1 hypothetical protein [Clostridium chromiireducens]RII33832.1 hypothetical protein D2A34_11610 [Clostridium chromiireducens]